MSNDLPLAGIRVFDLTHVWSGPMGTRILAALGAEVLKIENPARPDILRGNGNDLRLRYPDHDYGDDPRNRNAWFNTQNVGKKSVRLDLKSPDDVERARRLAATCDVVMSNYRAGVLSRMGFGYEQLRELRPDIVVVEMTAFPSTSPQARAAGFGAQFDAASGNTWLSGDASGPVLTGFAIGDPVGGMFAAAAVVTGLERRRRTGRGCHVEIPQSEAMMPLFGEQYVLESRGAAAPQRMNADPSGAPHGIYATGDGGWLALGVHDDEQWAAVAAAMTAAGGTVEAAWSTAAGRANDLDRVEAAVSAWLSGTDDPDALVTTLQAGRVPAARVAGPAELFADEQLRASGFFTELDHPSAGRHPYPGLPIRVDGVRTVPHGPAPLLGQHTDDVLDALPLERLTTGGTP
ncbi:CoA transferase [Streptomyces sp. NPDC047070]|uniref:CaiB/BaiF CoA transferase family protein n=1 Tax=Streptomyces sp. NPDC047070 TaxID=3154923 RepID=UPI0034553857